MSLTSRAQFRSFLDQAASFRRGLFARGDDGTESVIFYDGRVEPIPGYYSPVRARREVEELNLREMHESVVRIAKSAWPFPAGPAAGKPITFTENERTVTLRIDELAGSHPLNPEWVLGCNSL